jgi:peptidoglycan/LPS O-acetylase OafA/YrhL
MTNARTLRRSSPGTWLLRAGAVLGAAVGVVMLWIPEGGLRWLRTATTPSLALGISVALLASGAVLRRFERQESLDQVTQADE